MFQNKFMLFVLVITALILMVGVGILSGTSASSQVVSSVNAKATIPLDTYDWGNIPINGGKVRKTFAIKNSGSDVLQLTNVKTSCHCTTATVTLSGKQSPVFGMSGQSAWIGKVNPGEEAALNVVFDPAFHGPQGAGPVTRYISIETNDREKSKITFTLTAEVIK